jgi:hypothetical protein
MAGYIRSYILHIVIIPGIPSHICSQTRLAQVYIQHVHVGLSDGF